MLSDMRFFNVRFMEKLTPEEILKMFTMFELIVNDKEYGCISEKENGKVFSIRLHSGFPVSTILRDVCGRKGAEYTKYCINNNTLMVQRFIFKEVDFKCLPMRTYDYEKNLDMFDFDEE